MRTILASSDELWNERQICWVLLAAVKKANELGANGVVVEDARWKIEQGPGGKGYVCIDAICTPKLSAS